MFKKIFIILIVLLCLCTTMVMAKNDSTIQRIGLEVEEVAVLRINPDNQDISFTIEAPDIAGGKPKITAPDRSTYLQYTSIVGSCWNERKITAEVISCGPCSRIPSGTKLEIVASEPSAKEGTTGYGSTITFYPLYNDAQDLITGIKSGYTGTGLNKGANLKYTFDVNNWAFLDSADSRNIKIKYTLTDDA